MWKVIWTLKTTTGKGSNHVIFRFDLKLLNSGAIIKRPQLPPRSPFHLAALLIKQKWDEMGISSQFMRMLAVTCPYTQDDFEKTITDDLRQQTTTNATMQL
jgi:hypothetical protein